MTFTTIERMATFLIVWCLLSGIQTTEARPGNLGEYGLLPIHEDRCKLNDQMVIETCQRCAKQTKSPIVYPMCCVNDEEAYNWCYRYTRYGRQA